MKVIALIPARLDSTRLAQKLLIDLEGKSVIQRTFEATIATNLFHQVIVVTDAEAIAEIIQKSGGTAIMSNGNFESGTDRIASIAKDLEADVFVNVQGDEPFVQKNVLEQLIQLFNDQTVRIASLKKPLFEKTLSDSPNTVKVVCDKNDNALYFSRSVIPFVRDTETNITHYQHIGVYAFRKEALTLFPTLPKSELEQVEKLEQLRFLENGIGIKMTTVEEMGIGIDVAEDVERARAYLRNYL
ncbi:MAG TPA: 3-deoxy-manno-octulosonate cytidylyltransferase [Edaphocola sp.]|nr:3-deoxy-manno-octulosonate cytidylyltransferase [Edaphocola sp.]